MNECNEKTKFSPQLWTLSDPDIRLEGHIKADIRLGSNLI